MNDNPPSFPKPKELDYKKINELLGTICQLWKEVSRTPIIASYMPWTNEEEKILIKYYRKIPKKIISMAINRSPKAIQHKIENVIFDDD